MATQIIAEQESGICAPYCELSLPVPIELKQGQKRTHGHEEKWNEEKKNVSRPPGVTTIVPHGENMILSGAGIAIKHQNMIIESALAKQLNTSMSGRHGLRTAISNTSVCSAPYGCRLGRTFNDNAVMLDIVAYSLPLASCCFKLC